MDKETFEALHRTLNMMITALPLLSDTGFGEGTLSAVKDDVGRLRGWMDEVAKEYNQ